MLSGAVARRYAEAVFELAVEQGTVDEWLKDTRTIADYLGNRRLQFVMSEPNIAFARKRQVVEDLLGKKVQHDALGLALLLVERGIAEAAPRIRDQYEQRYNDYHNQAVAQVTTAFALDDNTRARIQQDLQQITGKRIILQEHVDPSILGGVIARVGDTLIDGSVQRKLQLLRQRIIQGGGSLGGPTDGGPDGTGGPDGQGPAPTSGVPGGGSLGGGGLPDGDRPSPNGGQPTVSPNGDGQHPAGPTAEAGSPLRMQAPQSATTPVRSLPFAVTTASPGQPATPATRHVIGRPQLAMETGARSTERAHLSRSGSPQPATERSSGQQGGGKRPRRRRR